MLTQNQFTPRAIIMHAESWTFWAALLGWGALCQAWAIILFAQIKANRDGLIIQPSTPKPNVAVPTVCIIIPACNEQDDIADCVATALAQDHRATRVIVVDDRSTDNTAAIVQQIAHAEPRLQYLRIDQLPSDWMGKSHALWQATQTCDDDWFLFIDADCRLESHAVTSSLNEIQKRKADILTLWPRHAGESFWEHMLIPLLGGIMALWFGRANDCAKSKGPAFANGQFIMITRDKYRAIGGHQSVKNALIEDVPFAMHAKSQGCNIWVAGGKNIASVRMYTHRKALVDGWSRIIFGALRNRLRVLLSILWLAFGSALPIIAAPFLAVAIYQHHATNQSIPFTLASLALTCLTHLILLTIVSYRFWGMGDCDRRYLWLYPISVVAVIGILLRAAWDMTTHRTVGWRNTTYRLTSNAQIIPQNATDISETTS